MKVIVDTSVWSLSLRRKAPEPIPEVAELSELISEVRVQMIGPIRQEILSGIKNQVQYQQLRNHLRVFPDLELNSGDYESAADFFNICRSKGLQGSNTDFLIVPLQCVVNCRF